MLKTIVVHIKDGYDIYCGRAGKGQSGYFGNLHVIGFCPICQTNHDRTSAISAFRKDFDKRIQTDAEFKKRVLELKGKRLGCFCFPSACHAEVYIDYLNQVDEVEKYFDNFPFGS